jgi:uncharacterized membrane protein (DUF441 family)
MIHHWMSLQFPRKALLVYIPLLSRLTRNHELLRSCRLLRQIRDCILPALQGFIDPITSVGIHPGIIIILKAICMAVASSPIDEAAVKVSPISPLD